LTLIRPGPENGGRSLPRTYSSEPVQVELKVPVRGIAWSWATEAVWPRFDDLPIDEAANVSWGRQLRELWDARDGEASRRYTTVLAGLLLREILQETQRVQVGIALRNAVNDLRKSLINVAFGEFRKVVSGVNYSFRRRQLELPFHHPALDPSLFPPPPGGRGFQKLIFPGCSGSCRPAKSSYKVSVRQTHIACQRGCDACQRGRDACQRICNALESPRDATGRP